MNFNRNPFLSLFLLLICLNWSCQKKETQSKINISKRVKYVDFFDSIRDSSDKMVIKLYYNENPKAIRNLKNIVWKKVVSTKSKIDSFDSLFDKIEAGGYFCCPYTHYNISFQNEGKEIRVYNVDTSTFKHQALFFDVSYQTNYLIPLSEWKDFLRNNAN
jgi:hypothetical protein